MRDEPIKEKAEDLEKDADRLEGKNEELEEDIEEAKSAAKLTEEQADPDNAAKDSGDVEEVAGDWEGEARNDVEPSESGEQPHPASEDDES